MHDAHDGTHDSKALFVRDAERVGAERELADDLIAGSTMISSLRMKVMRIRTVGKRDCEAAIGSC